MGKINWGRVFLCGILTGVVLYLLTAAVFVFALPETELRRAVEAAGRPTFSPLHFILHVAIGIWAMWVYAAIRPRYGPGPKTAAVAGVALWVIAALVDAVWGSVGLIPLGALPVPLAVTLPIGIVALMVGAWPYQE
ncbi:MAG: hypothetical protein HY656_00040 [Acidobacteria bacterium]|nr:hypothetical protein [Acidobacteriota bacterium]